VAQEESHFELCAEKREERTQIDKRETGCCSIREMTFGHMRPLSAHSAPHTAKQQQYTLYTLYTQTDATDTPQMRIQTVESIAREDAWLENVGTLL
jgi:hypothetical protein